MNECYGARDASKAVSTTNVIIAANRILEDYVGTEPVETNVKNVSFAQPQSKLSSEATTRPRRRHRLDRRDRSTVVQDACDVFDTNHVESFRENCRQLEISPVTYTYLRNMLHRNESILNLRNHGIGPVGTIALTRELIKSVKCVVELDLSANKLGDEGTATVCLFLEKDDFVMRLNLSRNALNKTGVDAVAHMLPQNKSLKHLVLSHNGLTEDDLELLASVLQTEKVLETLDLSSNSFSPRSGNLFGLLVSKNISLVKLNVSCNHIGDDGVRNLVSGLINNQSIRSLDISWNDISDEGAVWMADVLTSNRSIRDLNLSYNRIASKGVNCIAKGLTINVTLISLELSGNNLVSEDAVTLLESISKNLSMKLRHLHLGEVTISTESQRYFQNLRRMNPKFLVSGMIGAAGQPITMTSTNSVMVALEEYFEKNKLDPTVSFFE